jgi:hypothetical protein
METNAYGKPIRDRELLRRIEKARAEQCLNDPQGALHDPIEDAPDIMPIVRQVERRAEKESPIQGMGRCHDVWGRMRDILKNEHGIVWYPPSRINTDLLYD